MLIENTHNLALTNPATLVLVQLPKNKLQVKLRLHQRRLQTTSQKLTVVYLTVLISIDIIHHLLQLSQIRILMLLLQSSLQLIHSQITIRICIDLLKQRTQMMNILLRQLSWDVSQNQSFKLNNKNTTLEKLEKLRIFLKSRINFCSPKGLFIHGWLRILSIVIRFSAGTKIWLIRSFT